MTATMTDRNACIIADRKNGCSYQQLADKYDVSSERIRQILVSCAPELTGKILCINCGNKQIRFGTSTEYCTLCLKSSKKKTRDIVADRIRKFESLIEKKEDHLIWLGKHPNCDYILGEQLSQRILWVLSGRSLKYRGSEYLRRTCSEPKCIAPEHRKIT